MTSDAAGVFAQVIPALMIATFLSNIGFTRVPIPIRAVMFYCFGIALIGEFAVLYSLAFGIPLGKTMTGAVFSGAAALLLILLVITMFRIGTRYEQPGSNDEGNDDKDD